MVQNLGWCVWGCKALLPLHLCRCHLSSQFSMTLQLCRWGVLPGGGFPIGTPRGSTSRAVKPGWRTRCTSLRMPYATLPCPCSPGRQPSLQAASLRQGLSQGEQRAYASITAEPEATTSLMPYAPWPRGDILRPACSAPRPKALPLSTLPTSSQNQRYRVSEERA